MKRSASCLRASLFFSVATSGCGHQSAPPVVAPEPPPITAPAPVPEVAPVARQETPAPAPAVAPGPQRMEVTPAEVLTVGKWPEGIAVGEDALWVAESGERRITRFGRSEKVSARTSQVGRLPVDVVRDAGGNLYATVATDAKIVSIDPGSGAVKTVVKTKDYPEALAEARGVLYVLLWRGNSSESSSLLRVDTKAKAELRSEPLGKNAFDVGVGHGRVWVVRSEALTVLSDESLERVGELALQDQPMKVLAGPQGVYVGTAHGLVHVDPEKLAITHRTELSKRVSAMTMYGEELAAITEDGTIHLLDARTLAPRLSLVPEPFKPQALVAHGDALFATTHRDDRAGAVLVFRPSAEKPWK
jgi:hypothetical protein